MKAAMASFIMSAMLLTFCFSVAQQLPRTISIPLDKKMYEQLLTNPDLNKLREFSRQRSHQFIDLYDKEFYKINNLKKSEFITPIEEAKKGIDQYLDNAKEAKNIALSEDFAPLKSRVDNWYKYTYQITKKREELGASNNMKPKETNKNEALSSEIETLQVEIAALKNEIKNSNDALKLKSIFDIKKILNGQAPNFVYIFVVNLFVSLGLLAIVVKKVN